MRAKFRISSVAKISYGGADVVEEIKANAVSDPANEAWSKATPAGQLTIVISNPDAQGHLVSGADYYLDFIPVSKGVPA